MALTKNDPCTVPFTQKFKLEVPVVSVTPGSSLPLEQLLVLKKVTLASELRFTLTFAETGVAMPPVLATKLTGQHILVVAGVGEKSQSFFTVLPGGVMMGLISPGMSLPFVTV